MSLQANVLPEANIFCYPRGGSSGRRLDLGSYKLFKNGKEQMIEAVRSEIPSKFKVLDENFSAYPYLFEDRRWSIALHKPNNVIIQQSADGKKSRAAARLELEFKN